MQLALPEDVPLPLDMVRDDPLLLSAIRRAMPHGDYIGLLRAETKFYPPTAPGFDSWSYRCQYLAQETYDLGYLYKPEMNQPRLLAPPKNDIQTTFIVVTGEIKGKHVFLGERKGIVTKRFILANHSWDPEGQTQIPLEDLHGAQPPLIRALNVMIVSQRTKQNQLRIYAVVPTRIIRKGEYYCCDIEFLGAIDMSAYRAPVSQEHQPDSTPSTFILPEKPHEGSEGNRQPEQDDQTGTKG